MENTNTIQFPGDQPEWFVAVGDRYKGPFKAEEIFQKLNAHEISWVDHLYREKDAEWIRAADHPFFRSLQPVAPKPKPVAPPPPIQKQDDTKWFLYQKETQTGPYSTSEMKRLIQSAQLVDGAFVWQEQFSEWKLFTEVSELKPDLSARAPTPPPTPFMRSADQSPVQQAAQKIEQKIDQRAFPRKPLVAQVYATNQKKLITGICRDISVGGMQVLTDSLPGEAGVSIHLNVQPPMDSGLDPFVAEGVVVRILEDQRGFSFRFTKIDDQAKVSIERYIA